MLIFLQIAWIGFVGLLFSLAVLAIVHIHVIAYNFIMKGEFWRDWVKVYRIIFPKKQEPIEYWISNN